MGKFVFDTREASRRYTKPQSDRLFASLKRYGARTVATSMERERVGMGAKRDFAKCALSHAGHELGIYTEGTPRRVGSGENMEAAENFIAIVNISGIEKMALGLIGPVLKGPVLGKDVQYNFHFKRLEIKLARPETEDPRADGEGIMAAANAVSNLIVAANAMISQEALNWTEVVTTYDWHKVDEKKINPDNPELVAIEETRKEALAVVERTITSIGQVLSAASGYIADK